jgi:amylosucrase
VLDNRANFDAKTQYLDLDWLRNTGFNTYGKFVDLYSSIKPEQSDNRIIIEGYKFYWLTET